jgi:hypothetical protein
MVHAALLLLMLEAANATPRFTISLKRSTKIFSYPQARRPITPSYWVEQTTFAHTEFFSL